MRTSLLYDGTRTLTLAIVSYVVAAFGYSLALRISQLPHGPLWDDQLQRPFFFILLALLMVGLIVPYFTQEQGTALRTFSMFSTTFLLAYAVFNISGFVDPSLPLAAFAHYVIDPLRGKYAR